MRYDDPHLISTLAGEHVLGTLTGAARRRFERLIASRRLVQRAVADWEEYLGALTASLAPVAPPPRVWQRIADQLGFTPPADAGARQVSGWWRVLAGALAVLAVALGIERVLQAPQQRQLAQQVTAARDLEARLQQQIAQAAAESARLRAELQAAVDRAQAPAYVSLMPDAQGKPLWIVTLKGRALRINVVGMPAAQPGKSYELWLLPDGGAPISLGLLPQSGEAGHTLSDAALAAVTRTPALAVSLEPAGGSPTGQPTGPVLFSAALLRG